MTRVEAQNKFSEALSAHAFLFQDILGKQYSITSYERAVSFAEFGFCAFSGRINAYADEFSGIKDKIESIVSEIIKDDPYDIINAVRVNFAVASYSNIIMLKSIAPESLSDVPGRTLHNILQIYDEYGDEVLNHYIEILKNPGNVNSYLSNPDKQLAAMEYIVLSTGHHSSKKLMRDLTGKKMLDEFKNNYNEILDGVTNRKDGYSAFLDEKKNEYREWSQNVSNRANDFFEEAENRRKALEATYDAKLKVEKPADFMKKQSKKYKRSFIMWSGLTILLSISVMFLLGIILSPKMEIEGNLIEIHLFSKNMPISSSIIIVAIISLIVYIIRIFIKVALSAKHISEEYQQKYTLTYFYLSLTNSGRIDKDVEKYILMSLFSKADTGLIKNSGDADAFLVNMLEKITK